MIEKERCKEPQKINLDRLFIKGNQNDYSVHKNIVYSKYLDIPAFFGDSSFYKSRDFKILIKSQNEIIKYLNY